jgi:MATE family multidrug resistance protein
MKRSRLRILTRLKRRVAHELGKLPSWLGGRPRNAGIIDTPAQRTRRDLVGLAGPIAGAMAGEVVLGLVDTKLVSGLGASALGGVGLGMTVLFLWYAIVFGVLRGVKVRASFAIGEQRPFDALRYAQAGLLIGALMGLVPFVLARDPRPILSLLGASPELTAPAVEFLRAVTWGSPATCALAALIQHRQAIGDARTPMFVGVTGNVVNGVLGYGLIYGRFGLPALGVAGSGFATAAAEYLELAWMLAIFARDGRIAGSLRAAMLPLRRALRDVATIGIPTGAHFGAELLAFTAFTAILGSLGPEEIAAHQIALVTIRASFLPGHAVAEAASVLVGQSLGRRSLAEADRVTSSALVLAMTFMAGCGVIFGVFGEALARAFSSDAGVIRITTKLLLVAAVFQLLDAANMVLRGALRGARDVRFVAVLGVSIVWVCVPGAALLLGKYAGLGALGGWLGFIFETPLGASLLFVRYRRGSWRLAYAESERRTAPRARDRAPTASAA